jgi:serine/threonine protein kinase
MPRLQDVVDALRPKFKVYGIIGSGVYGSVLAVKNLTTGTYEAIKIMLPSPRAALMPVNALRELQALGPLQHAAIVSIKGVVIMGNGATCIRMSLYSGNLRQLLQKNKQYWMPLSDVQYIFAEIVKGLHAATGTVHRDLKPENILLRADGKHVSITDWGMSKYDCGEATEDLRQTTDVISKWYAPPETLAGRGLYDASVDVWSLGIMLAEMLAGDIVFRHHTSEQSRRHFVAHSIFDLLGTPVSEEDVAFIEKTCSIDAKGLPHQHPKLRERVRRTDVPDAVWDMMDAMLKYTNRIALQDLVRLPFVQEARFPDTGIAFANTIVLQPLPLLARNTISPVSIVTAFAVRRRASVAGTVESASVSAAVACGWNPGMFPSAMLHKATESLRLVGTKKECGHICMLAMHWSHVLEACPGSADETLVALLTLSTAAVLNIHDRMQLPFVQALFPGMTDARLHTAECRVLFYCSGCIPSMARILRKTG